MKVDNPLIDGNDLADGALSAGKDALAVAASTAGKVAASAGDAVDEGPSGFLLFVQALVTIVFGPLAFFFNITVLVDIFANSPWDFASLEMLVVVILPALSFTGACYILISYWMDQDSWSVLRMRTMFASIPMCVFFAINLMSQSSHHRFLSCEAEAFVQQVTPSTPSPPSSRPLVHGLLRRSPTCRSTCGRR